MLSSRILQQVVGTGACQRATIATTSSLGAALKKSVAIIEAYGGTDKGPDGYRKDSLPIVDAIRKHKGWYSQVVWYNENRKEEFAKYVTDNFDAAIMRVNPGNVDDVAMYRLMGKIGNKIKVFEHPDLEFQMGAKDAMVMFAGASELVPSDTYSYKTVAEIKKKFPKTLAKGERVIKQNFGATGQGIWRVVVQDDVPKDKPVPLSAKVKCTHAEDNSVHFMTLGEFCDFCKPYCDVEEGGMVDTAFLPRIKEGEIRVLLVGEEPVKVIKKTPAKSKDAFSATLFSGAHYVYSNPDKYAHMMPYLAKIMPLVKKHFKITEVPLLWSMDFILDYGPKGEDSYVLGEFNISCLGFTSHLKEGIQEKIAAELVKRLTKGA